MKRLELWWLKFRANSIRDSILIATDRHDRYVCAAEEISAWVRREQERLRKLNTAITMLEAPQELIAREIT